MKHTLCNRTSPQEQTSAAMTSPKEFSWNSLVRRSMEAWSPFDQDLGAALKEVLQSYTTLDELLRGARGGIMFWFFQRREAFLSQGLMTKWSRDHLDNYVLLPATNGFVKRTECIFVSHFWHSKDHPDPSGKYVRLLQEELRKQDWLYIWTDWTCAPQAPRNQEEKVYFLRTLQTMSGIIRNSAFIWFYPPFEARLWILYEVAEYTLTCSNEFHKTTDIKEFADHIAEMLQIGVRSTLEKHGYRCTYDLDKAFIVSWLEILVLLKRLQINIDDVRRLLDYLTWFPSTKTVLMYTIHGLVELCRYEGTLILDGKLHTFTPFPEWEDGEYSTNKTLGLVYKPQATIGWKDWLRILANRLWECAMGRWL